MSNDQRKDTGLGRAVHRVETVRLGTLGKRYDPETESLQDAGRTWGHDERQQFAAGITPVTEGRAYGAVTPHAPDYLTDRQFRGLVRALGIMATYPRVPMARGSRSLGRTLARVHHGIESAWPGQVEGANSDVRRTSMSTQVDSLPMLPLEAASQVLMGLVSRAQEVGAQVDFHDLAYVLTYWGDGISTQSRNIRNTVVRDFYRPRRKSESESAGGEPDAQ